MPAARGDADRSQGLRADARRNRERVIAAAIELFVEEGVEVPLDAIARHAEVGIATLYRRFPDRDALVQAVALAAFTLVRDLAARVRDDRDGQVLMRFVTGITELRVGALMTSLLPVISESDPDPRLDQALDDLLEAVGDLVTVAHEAGELRPDVTADDLLLLVAATTRPLDGVPPAYAEAVTPRLLDLLVEGLRPRSDPAVLSPAPPRADSFGRPSVG